MLTDILTVAQVAVVSCQAIFHSTGVGITRMQQAMVLITTALVLAVCANELPEGKDCVLKCDVLQI